MASHTKRAEVVPSSTLTTSGLTTKKRAKQHIVNIGVSHSLKRANSNSNVTDFNANRDGGNNRKHIGNSKHTHDRDQSTSVCAKSDQEHKEPQPPAQQWWCKRCDKQFMLEKHLVRHQLLHSAQDANSSVSKKPKTPIASPQTQKSPKSEPHENTNSRKGGSRSASGKLKIKPRTRPKPNSNPNPKSTLDTESEPKTSTRSKSSDSAPKIGSPRGVVGSSSGSNRVKRLISPHHHTGPTKDHPTTSQAITAANLKPKASLPLLPSSPIVSRVSPTKPALVKSPKPHVPASKVTPSVASSPPASTMPFKSKSKVKPTAASKLHKFKPKPAANNSGGDKHSTVSSTSISSGTTIRSTNNPTSVATAATPPTTQTQIQTQPASTQQVAKSSKRKRSVAGNTSTKSAESGSITLSKHHTLPITTITTTTTATAKSPITLTLTSGNKVSADTDRARTKPKSSPHTAPWGRSALSPETTTRPKNEHKGSATSLSSCSRQNDDSKLITDLANDTNSDNDVDIDDDDPDTTASVTRTTDAVVDSVTTRDAIVNGDVDVDVGADVDVGINVNGDGDSVDVNERAALPSSHSTKSVNTTTTTTTSSPSSPSSTIFTTSNPPSSSEPVSESPAKTNPSSPKKEKKGSVKTSSPSPSPSPSPAPAPSNTTTLSPTSAKKVALAMPNVCDDNVDETMAKDTDVKADHREKKDDEDVDDDADAVDDVDEEKGVDGDNDDDDADADNADDDDDDGSDDDDDIKNSKVSPNRKKMATKTKHKHKHKHKHKRKQALQSIGSVSSSVLSNSGGGGGRHRSPTLSDTSDSRRDTSDSRRDRSRTAQSSAIDASANTNTTTTTTTAPAPVIADIIASTVGIPCSYCTKRFKRKDFLSKHEQKHVDGLLENSVSRTDAAAAAVAVNNPASVDSFIPREKTSTGRTRKPIKRFEASSASQDNKQIRAKLETTRLFTNTSPELNDDDGSVSSSSGTSRHSKPSRKRKTLQLPPSETLDIREAIWSAVKSFDDDQLQRLLVANEGIDLNILDSDGKTPLLYAAKCGNEDIVETLCGANAFVNTTDNLGRTPMLWAAKNGDMEVVNVLLEANADVNIVQDEKGWSPAFLAALKGHQEVLDRLVEANADLNKHTTDGESPLHYAARYHLHRMADTLIASNADVNAVDKHNESVLWRLKGGEQGKKLFKKLLEANADIDKPDRNHMTMLEGAVEADRDDMIRFLTQLGASVNNTVSGESSLSRAVRKNNLESVDILLSAGSDNSISDTNSPSRLSKLQAQKSPAGLMQLAFKNKIWNFVDDLISKGVPVTFEDRDTINLTDDSGHTVTMRAVMRQDAKVLRIMIESGANVNTPDREGCSPLTWSVRRGNTEMINQLIAAKADVHAVDAEGKTALWWATNIGDVDDVEKLLQVDATPNTRDTRDSGCGATALPLPPLLCAARDGHVGVVKLLLHHGAVIDDKDTQSKTPLLWATENNHVQIVESLVEAQADVNVADSDGETPLWSATRNKQHDMLTLLIAANADVNCTRVTKVTRVTDAALMDVTPVWCAASNGCLQSLETLARAGADIDHASVDGLTPLQWSLLNHRTKVFRCLLEANADVNATQRNWETPLWMALKAGDKHVVKALLKAGADPNFTHKDTLQSPLLHAGSSKDHALMRALLSANADPNQSNNLGVTPLVQAAKLDDVSNMKLLINWRGNINMPDGCGVTPVAACGAKMLVQIADTLIESEADFSKSDLVGDTPLHKVARDATGAAARHTLGKLLTANADIGAYNNFSQSALDVSQEPIVITTLASWCRGRFHWTPSAHHTFSPAMRQCVWTLLLIGQRHHDTRIGINLSRDLWLYVLSFLKDNEFFFTPTNKKMEWVLGCTLTASPDVALANQWLTVLSSSVAIAAEHEKKS